MSATATDAPTALTAEEADAFRARCREFLAAHARPGARRDLAAAKEFQGALADAGLAGLAYPTEYGGAGQAAADNAALPDSLFYNKESSFKILASDLKMSTKVLKRPK